VRTGIVGGGGSEHKTVRSTQNYALIDNDKRKLEFDFLGEKKTVRPTRALR